MKKFFLLGGFAAMIATTATTTSCKKDDTPSVSTGTEGALNGATVSRTTDNQTEYAEPSNNTLSGEITTNMVLKTGKTYNMKGFTYVRQGATLRIEPGVTIKGEKSSKSTLIITRNGKIEANGTAAQPIVFTSGEASPTRGDWGGIIILGNARTNGQFSNTAGYQEIEGGVNNEKGFGLHGGTNDADNSGVIKYVRIEYPGIAFQPNSEINGLTMGSVGSGTTIDFVEVYRSGDDAFEWFGGTVNAKHLLAIESTDDDFDTDNGFSGKVQYGISLRDSSQADFAQGGTSNGFECDNDANGSTATPRTSAVFSNFTMVGPKAPAGVNPSSSKPFGRAAHIRRNAAVSIFNSAFIGWNTGLRIDGNATSSGFQNGSAEFKNNYVANASRVADTSGTLSGSGIINPIDFFNTAGAGNTSEASITAAMLGNLVLGAGFNAQPGGGSPLLSGASFSSSKLSGMETTTFRGAIGTTNWTSGWAKF